MMNRQRPRLNITVDPDLKERLQSLADRLNISVSRLIEEVMFEFLELYQEDPMIGSRVKKSILDRKRETTATEDETEAKKQIEQILNALENTENRP